MFNRIFRFTFLAILLALGGCGVGQSGDVPPAPQQEDTSVPPTPSTSVKGNAVDGLILGGTVTIYPLNQDGTFGELLASTLTDENGLFSIDIQTNETNLAFKVTGGRYIDEWTGETVYDGLVYIKAICGQYYEWSTNKYVLTEYPLTSLVEVKKGGDYTVKISPLTSMVKAYHDNKAKFGSAELKESTALFERHFGLDFNQSTPVYFEQAAQFFSAGHKYGLLLASLSRLASHYFQYVDEIEAPGTEANSVELLNVIVRDISDGIVDGKETIEDKQEDIFFNGYPLSKYTIRHLIGRAAVDVINSERNLTGLKYKDVINFLLSIALDNHILFEGAPVQIDEESPLITLKTKNQTYANGLFDIAIEAVDISGIKEFYISSNGARLPDFDNDPAVILTQLDTTQYPDGDLQFLISVTDNANNTTLLDNYTISVDNTPPDFNLSGATEIFTNLTQYSFIGNVIDKGVGGVLFICDGDSFKNKGGQVSCSKNFTALENGPYNLTLSALDALENKKDVGVVVYYDTNPPVFVDKNNGPMKQGNGTITLA